MPRDLVTVLVTPQTTMRRVLAGRDRWVPQIVILAFLCASVQDSNPRHLDRALPGMGFSVIALVALGLIAGALLWFLALFLLSWIATFAGRKLGGSATTTDVRAAMAWGLVPILFSPLYRIPFSVLERHIVVPQQKVSVVPVLLDFAAGGGCSYVVLYLTLQSVFAVWSLVVASFCVAEAEQFPPSKGFATIAITLAVPAVVIAACVAAFG